MRPELEEIEKKKSPDRLTQLLDPLTDALLDTPLEAEKKRVAERFLLLYPTLRQGFFSRLSLRDAGLLQALNVDRVTFLIQHVIRGEEKEVKEILKVFPHLLLVSGREVVIDYSGRSISGLTAFQAACCAGDTDMIKMMLPYFDRCPNGQAVMRAQIAEIFPDAEGGLEGHLKSQKQNVFDFTAIVAAINRATEAEATAALAKTGARFTETDEAREKPDDQLALTEKLNRFREKFTAKSYAEVVFNREHLLKAFTIYNEKFDDWNWDQRDLFWRQVIGFVQRFLPACDAQAFAQGLYGLVKNNEAFLRSFDFKYSGGSFYPFDLNSCSNFGFDYAAYGGGGAGRRCRGTRVVHCEAGILYKIYVEQKRSAWKTYADQPAATGPLRNFIK